MMSAVTTWVGQVTTGHGFMILGPTLLAVATGSVTWPVAVPMIVAGAVGLLWPENTQLKSASQAVATDVEALISAYRTGVDHGASPPPAGVPVMPPRVVTAGILTLVMATGLTLTACATQTPAQQAATGTAIASGLLCLADTSGRIVATATTSDPDSVKAMNSAVAAGGVLATDADCRTAVVAGVSALSTTTTSGH